MIFAIAANIVAGLATVAFGWVDDKIGPKNVIMLSLTAMVVAGFGVFFLHAHGPIVFWSLGLVLCVFVGPTQSASRSFLSRIIPAGREGEVFGLYATTGRAVSFMAPAMYGLFLLGHPRHHADPRCGPGPDGTRQSRACHARPHGGLRPRRGPTPTRDTSPTRPSESRASGTCRLLGLLDMSCWRD